MLSKSNFTFLWLKCLWNEFFPLLLETGKYANLRICIKILLKKTQSLENPSSSYLIIIIIIIYLFNHVSPRSFYKLVQNVNVKGPERSSDVTNVIKRYCLQRYCLLYKRHQTLLFTADHRDFAKVFTSQAIMYIFPTCLTEIL